MADDGLVLWGAVLGAVSKQSLEPAQWLSIQSLQTGQGVTEVRVTTEIIVHQ